MDFLIKHWAAFPRRFPSGTPLGTSDFLVKKQEVLHRKFSTCNFSIILRGSGFFEREGRRWDVVAPCVITQWPGERPRYGPGPETWDEWYLIYHARLFRAFRARGFIDTNVPVWPVADPGGLLGCLEEFAAGARSPEPSPLADVIDRIAERAILCTKLAPSIEDREGAALRQIAAAMRAEPGRYWNFEQTASAAGCSLPTFRRKWKAVFGDSPGEHLGKIRMAHACRLLAESRMRVKEIAEAAGFGDALYFSRRFRKLVGDSPRGYRAAYRVIGPSPSREE